MSNYADPEAYKEIFDNGAWGVTTINNYVLSTMNDIQLFFKRREDGWHLIERRERGKIKRIQTGRCLDEDQFDIAHIILEAPVNKTPITYFQ